MYRHRAVITMLRVVIERSLPCCGSSSSVYYHITPIATSSSSGHCHVVGYHRVSTAMLRAIIECLLPCCGLSSSGHCHVVGYHRAVTAISHPSPHRHPWPFGDDFQSLLAVGRLLGHGCFGKFHRRRAKNFSKTHDHPLKFSSFPRQKSMTFP